MSVTRHGPGEQLPIADRARTLDVFRGTALVGLLLLALLRPDLWTVPRGPVLVGGAMYAAVAAASGLLRHVLRGRHLRVVAGLTLLDGVGLGVALYATGGAASPIRYLVILHVVVAALAISYRTGVKLAIWDGLVLAVIEEAQAVAVLPEVARLGDDLIPLVVAVWVTAAIASTASATNERELRRRRYDLEALAGMAADLERTTDIVDVGHIAVEAVAATFDATRVVLLEVRGERVTVLAGNGVREDIGTEAVRDLSTVDEVVHTRRTILVRRLHPEGDTWLRSVLPDARNLILVPLIAEDDVLGVLVVERGAGALRIAYRVVRTLERFASHIGLALANAQLHRTLASMATTDGLTELANRRAFDERLMEELDRSRRLGTPVSVALIDLDRFKDINDTHGHLVGDEVLRAVAAVLERTARSADLPARYGGEEFGVVLSGTDLAAAKQAGERLRRAIAAAASPVPVTVTVGLATSSDGTATPEQLVAAADRALYQGKQGGRNRTVVTSLEPATGTSPLRRAGV